MQFKKEKRQKRESCLEEESGQLLMFTENLTRGVWGTVPSVGNVAQPLLGKASGERGWRAGPVSMGKFSSGKSGLHCT